jgi:hypothetical protein
VQTTRLAIFTLFVVLVAACTSAPAPAVSPALAPAPAAAQPTPPAAPPTSAAPSAANAANALTPGEIQKPGPIQKPGEIQKPGPIQQPGAIQQPAAAPTSTPAPSAASSGSGAIQKPGEIQKPGNIQQPGAFQQPGEIQQPGAIQTLAPFDYPTIPPFQVPGEIQQPGVIQRPGEFQQPGAIQSVRPPSMVPGLPANAQCLNNAAIQPLGPFTAQSFQLEISSVSGDCQVPAGLVLKSSEGLQDMLVMTSVTVPAGGSAKVTVYSNCMDINKHGPQPGSKYTLGGMVAADSPLGKVVANLPKVQSNKITVMGLQAAVWSITNDVTRDHVARVFQFGDADFESTRAILETTGVGTEGKALFK